MGRICDSFYSHAEFVLHFNVRCTRGALFTRRVRDSFYPQVEFVVYSILRCTHGACLQGVFLHTSAVIHVHSANAYSNSRIIFANDVRGTTCATTQK